MVQIRIELACRLRWFTKGSVEIKDNNDDNDNNKDNAPDDVEV